MRAMIVRKLHSGMVKTSTFTSDGPRGQDHERMVQGMELISRVSGLDEKEIRQKLEALQISRMHCQKGTGDKALVAQFSAVREKIYEQEAYPMLEHYYYACTHHAMKRKEFVVRQISAMDSSPLKCCDLGVGPGVILSSVLLKQRNWQGYGMDISSKCVKYASKMMALYGLTDRVTIEQADIRSTPYPDEAFDLVIATEVLEHVPEPIEGLRELARILKPKALAIISLPIRLRQPEHLYIFADEQEIKQACYKAGLSIEHFETWKSGGAFVDYFALCRKADHIS